MNYKARHLMMREDILAAPLFAMLFNKAHPLHFSIRAARRYNGRGIEVTNLVMTDAHFQFGALSAWQAQDGAVDLGFRYPGTVHDFGGRRGEPPVERWVRRYHPISEGFTQSYVVQFRFGQGESFAI